MLHLILDVYEEVHGVRSAGVGDASTTESIHTQCLEIIVEVQQAAPCLAHLLLSAFFLTKRALCVLPACCCTRLLVWRKGTHAVPGGAAACLEWDHDGPHAGRRCCRFP